MSSDPELEALKRPFRIGLLAVLAVIIAIGGVIAAWGSNADRPAGIAERWLVALSDTTRDGVKDDALQRMDDYMAPVDGTTTEQVAEVYWASRGGDGVGGTYLPMFDGDGGAADDGKPLLDTIRIGRPADQAMTMDGQKATVVPVQVARYEADDPVDAYVYLVDHDGDGWKVTGFLSTEQADRFGTCGATGPDDCPGFPIERPEPAPLGFWLGAVALGVLVTLGATFAIRAATPNREPVSGAAT